MLIKSIKVDETLLGKIHYYEMPFPDVYFMSGKRNEGYVVPKDYNGEVLTQKALAFGVECDGLLFFPAGVTMILLITNSFNIVWYTAAIVRKRRLFGKSC